MVTVHYHSGQFPPKDIDWPRLVPLLHPASAALARYDGVLEGIPNARLLLAPMTMQEAVLSSRIEGTQATMGEVLSYQAGGERGSLPSEKEADIREILNYRMALDRGVLLLKKLPLSGRLVRETHSVLMSGVRGADRGAGQFRNLPNWIGPPGCEIASAKFVPVAPENLPTAFAEWEKYVNSKQPNVLVQLAFAHAEFEALHPFLDGNGRLGRMLVPLFLFQRDELSSPTFYLSEYLESHRDEYYAGLLNVSQNGDWTGWAEFFLEAIRSQAETNTLRARQIIKLYREKKDWMLHAARSQHAILVLDFIFQKPIFRASDIVAAGASPPAAAKRLLRLLLDHGELGVLRRGKGRNPAVYEFRELIRLAESRKFSHKPA